MSKLRNLERLERQKQADDYIASLSPEQRAEELSMAYKRNQGRGTGAFGW